MQCLIITNAVSSTHSCGNSKYSHCDMRVKTIMQKLDKIKKFRLKKKTVELQLRQCLCIYLSVV